MFRNKRLYCEETHTEIFTDKMIRYLEFVSKERKWTGVWIK